MMRRLVAVAGAVLCAVALVLAGWWAGRSALDPPADPLASPQPVSIAVQTGTVGRSLPLSATARWQTVNVVRSAATGVVTSVDIDPAKPIVEGSKLATVNLAPTFVALGGVPVFRDMAAGAKGADVLELEQFLARAGFDPGEQDGTFSSATAQAVQAWQRATNAAETGTVMLGSLVFTPDLPARGRAAVVVGDTVGAGDTLLELVGGAPQFTVGVTDAQVSLIPPAAAVSVSGPDGAWAATAGPIDTADGERVIELTGPGGAAVCGTDCDAVPLVGDSAWAASVTVTPEATGPVVPVGAIQTDVDGSQFVITSAGARIPVTVIASADGQAVVRGVDIGAEVVLPGTPP